MPEPSESGCRRVGTLLVDPSEAVQMAGQEVERDSLRPYLGQERLPALQPSDHGLQVLCRALRDPGRDYIRPMGRGAKQGHQGLDALVVQHTEGHRGCDRVLGLQLLSEQRCDGREVVGIDPLEELQRAGCMVRVPAAVDTVGDGKRTPLQPRVLPQIVHT